MSLAQQMSKYIAKDLNSTSHKSEPFKADKSKNLICQLPLELLIKAFKWLEFEDFLKLRTTCRTLNGAVENLKLLKCTVVMSPYTRLYFITGKGETAVESWRRLFPVQELKRAERNGLCFWLNNIVKINTGEPCPRRSVRDCISPENACNHTLSYLRGLEILVRSIIGALEIKARHNQGNFLLELVVDSGLAISGTRYVRYKTRGKLVLGLRQTARIINIINNSTLPFTVKAEFMFATRRHRKQAPPLGKKFTNVCLIGVPCSCGEVYPKFENDVNLQELTYLGGGDKVHKFLNKVAKGVPKIQRLNLELNSTLEITSEPQLKHWELPNVDHLVLSYPEYVDGTGRTVRVDPQISGPLDLDRKGNCLVKKLTLDSNGEFLIIFSMPRLIHLSTTVGLRPRRWGWLSPRSYYNKNLRSLKLVCHNGITPNLSRLVPYVSRIEYFEIRLFSIIVDKLKPIGRLQSLKTVVLDLVDQSERLQTTLKAKLAAKELIDWLEKYGSSRYSCTISIPPLHIDATQGNTNA